mmetsp:Transcript_34195/g.78000  ORF Transcript_34195/g.78000 Transcript_34195/m.78000 type:complete len:274 (+) Transcript_34195:108-929(+)
MSEVSRDAGAAEERGQRAICFPERMLGCTFCSVDDNDIVLRSRLQDLEPAGSDDEGDEDYPHLVGEDSIFTHMAPETSSSGSGSTQKVQQYMLALSSVFEKEGWAIEHLHDDRYLINDREVCIFMLPAGVPGPQAKEVERALSPAVAHFASRMMVTDGPLLQPLLDYMLQTGQNEHYDAKGTENPAAVTGAGRRLEFYFGNHQNPNDRVEAMMQATMQAEMRRKVSAQSPQATARATVSSVTTPRVALPQAVSSQGRVKVEPFSVSVTRKLAR